MNIFLVINKSLKRYKVPGRQSILAGGVRSSDEMIVETLEAVLGPGSQETEAVVVAAADVVHGLGPGARRGLAVVRVGRGGRLLAAGPAGSPVSPPGEEGGQAGPGGRPGGPGGVRGLLQHVVRPAALQCYRVSCEHSDITSYM